MLRTQLNCPCAESTNQSSHLSPRGRGRRAKRGGRGAREPGLRRGQHVPSPFPQPAPRSECVALGRSQAREPAVRQRARSPHEGRGASYSEFQIRIAVEQACFCSSSEHCPETREIPLSQDDEPCVCALDFLRERDSEVLKSTADHGCTVDAQRCPWSVFRILQEPCRTELLC